MNKYTTPPNKNKRGTHNRPYYGPWYGWTKEQEKENRKWAKGLRHKLLFHIPLTEEEQSYVDGNPDLTPTTSIDKHGRFCYYSGHGSARWRFTDAKEDAESKIERGFRKVKRTQNNHTRGV